MRTLSILLTIGWATACGSVSDGDGADDGEPIDAAQLDATLVDAGLVDASIDAEPIPDSGPQADAASLTTRIYVEGNGKVLHVFNAEDLANLGSIPLAEETYLNDGLSVGAGSVWEMRIKSQAPPTVIAIDPVTQLIRPGYPKNTPECLFRGVSDAGMHCFVGSEVRLYSTANFQTLLKSFALSAPLDRLFSAHAHDFLVAVVDNTATVLDGSLTPVATLLGSSPSGGDVSVSLGRVVLHNSAGVQLFNLATGEKIAGKGYAPEFVTGAVFDEAGNRIVVLLNSGKVATLSATDGAEILAPTARASTQFGHPSFDRTRGRLVARDKNGLVVLTGDSLDNAPGSPAALVSIGFGTVIF